jgi:hypothetical protein
VKKEGRKEVGGEVQEDKSEEGEKDKNKNIKILCRLHACNGQKTTPQKPTSSSRLWSSEL